MIQDFQNDKFLVAKARKGFTNAGEVDSLTSTGISDKLNTTNFGKNYGAQFTFDSRIFVVINDGIAGFNANKDGIVEVTGLIGSLSVDNFVL